MASMIVLIACILAKGEFLDFGEEINGRRVERKDPPANNPQNNSTNSSVPGNKTSPAAPIIHIAYGLTWGSGGYVPDHPELFRVACGGSPYVPIYPPYHSADGSCNPYAGDTPCYLSRPILCFAYGNYKRPCYSIDCRSHAEPKEFYCGWSEGALLLSDPVIGNTLTSRAAADKICSTQFGIGFRMASHGDGRWVVGMSATNYCYSTWPTTTYGGGWSYSGYGVRGVTWTRFWVAIDDQPGNCWNS